ncbi:hypothetical protein [Streptomyces luteogriseus]|uniref:hypothetical protein n=1 Tax=Streptomyces luteogriseus TaxID=68233 RepID=UPI003801BF36
MQPFVPLGRDLAHRGQKCSHSPSDTKATDCPNDATWHIMWTTDGDVGLSCTPHMDVARRFVFVDSHRVGPDCAMPGALWDLDGKRCVYPDESTTALAEINQPEPVVSVHGARELNPEAREAVEALIAVAKQQITDAAPAHNAGPTVAECAEADRRWPLEKAGE